MFRIGRIGVPGSFANSQRLVQKLQIPYNLVRHNSSQSTPFKGEVPLEKYLTVQLMAARKSRDTFRTNVLRTVIGELQTEQKLLSTQQGVTTEKLEQSALKSVRKAITKRRAAAAEYRTSQLADAAETEDQEAAFLETLLPKQLDRDQLRDTVQQIYSAAIKDGTFVSEEPSDVQTILKVITERVEDVHGKGSVSKGDIASIMMPLLQKDGFMKQSGKKSK